MKRAAIYLRVSTQDQTTSNQEHERRQAAERRLASREGLQGITASVAPRAAMDGRRSKRCAGLPPSANST
jgi:DNA invertase Pin-like site-specific DNA recombinase